MNKIKIYNISANNYDSYSAPAAPTYQQAYQQPVQHQHQHYQEPAYQGVNHKIDTVLKQYIVICLRHMLFLNFMTL